MYHPRTVEDDVGRINSQFVPVTITLSGDSGSVSPDPVTIGEGQRIEWSTADQEAEITIRLKTPPPNPPPKPWPFDGNPPADQKGRAETGHMHADGDGSYFYDVIIKRRGKKPVTIDPEFIIRK